MQRPGFNALKRLLAVQKRRSRKFGWHFDGTILPTTGLLGSNQHTAVGSEEARSRAGLRPPLKLHVQVCCMQLARRFSVAEMTKKESNRATEQAHSRHKAWAKAAVSSQRCANAFTDATRSVAGSSRRGDGRVYERGRVCNTRPNLAIVG